MNWRSAFYAVIGGCAGACLMLVVGLFILLKTQNDGGHSHRERIGGITSSGEHGSTTQNRTLDIELLIGGGVGALLTLAVGALTQRGAASYGNATFDKITCTELEVVQPTGKCQVLITSSKDGGFITAFGGDNHIVLGMGATEYGGQVDVFGKDGQLTTMDSGEHGGRVKVSGKDKKSSGAMFVSEGGGMFGVVDKDEDAVVTITAGEHGGEINLISKDTKSGTHLGVDENGGRIEVNSKVGKSCVLMNFGETTSMVSVLDRKGKSGACMGIDEHGGQVSLLGDEKVLAQIGALEHGSRITLADKSEDPRMGMEVDESSANIYVAGRGGVPKSFMNVIDRSAFVGVTETNNTERGQVLTGDGLETVS